ncbi:MAG: NADH-quinone oxidoreductase subunit C [Phycisphaerae bacterium]|nr:NADH-quinone oxidoreductase subunit C [Phycisphaerae bacterium]
MTADEIIATLVARFGATVTAAPGAYPHVVVAPAALVELATFLRDEADLRFDMLRSITAIDDPKENRLTAAYDLISTVHRHAFAVKVSVAKDSPRIPSAAGVWPAAEWHEREAYDLMGIVFDGHPDLRRILLPDDWQGHPLRKDYVFPKEYGGIPC